MAKKTEGWSDWKMYGPPLTHVGSDVPHEAEARVFVNNRYEVIRYELPGGLTWLSIKRAKKEHVHDWRELQRVKNEICGPDREAFELYPGEWRLIDTANQYHLWVLPLGQGINVGWLGRHVAEPFDDTYEFNKGRQRPLPGWMERTEYPDGRMPMCGPYPDEHGVLQMVVDLTKEEDDDGED